MNKNIVLTAVVTLMIGAAAGYMLAPAGDKSEQMVAGNSEVKKPLFYRNPMNPAITSPMPAQDEMGMDYIPVYADGTPDMMAGTVTIDPGTQGNFHRFHHL